MNLRKKKEQYFPAYFESMTGSAVYSLSAFTPPVRDPRLRSLKQSGSGGE